MDYSICTLNICKDDLGSILAGLNYGVGTGQINCKGLSRQSHSLPLQEGNISFQTTEFGAFNG